MVDCVLVVVTLLFWDLLGNRRCQLVFVVLLILGFCGVLGDILVGCDSKRIQVLLFG